MTRTACYTFTILNHNTFLLHKGVLRCKYNPSCIGHFFKKAGCFDKCFFIINIFIVIYTLSLHICHDLYL